MTDFRPALLSAALLAGTSSHALADIKVIASVKPIHSLAASIMEGVGTPSLIVDGAASPHTYSLKPSQAEELQNANIIFWVGHEFEAFLEKPIETIGKNAQAVSLIDSKGIRLLPPREDGNFEAHAHEEEAAGHAGHDDHDKEVDAHIWLDPQNAIIIAQEIETALSKADPANAATYAANTKKLTTDLAALETEINTMLAPVKDRGFIVFHDAYQYFEARFGVKALGSITVSPEVMPGAERIADLREKVSSLKASCVFSEPNFDPKLVNTIIEGTSAKTGTLDPEASGIAAGPALYGTMMRGVAASVRDCLS